MPTNKTKIAGHIGISHVGPRDDITGHGYVVSDQCVLVSLNPWTGAPLDLPGDNDASFLRHLLDQPGILLRRIDLQTVLEGSILVTGHGATRWIPADEITETGLLVAVQQARLAWPEWDRSCEAAGVIRLPIEAWD